MGETIEFTVTFSAAVTVTGDPRFAFSLSNPGQTGIDDKLADYDPAASTATTLVFSYTVLAADQDTSGIWVGDQSRTLKLDPDDRILTAPDDSLPASLTHAEQGTKENHKVDGSRGTPVANTAPVFDPAAVDRSIAENTATDQDVGAAVTATDADAADTLAYTLGGDDMASFDIVGTSGQIRTISGVSYDHEATKNTYTVTVTASDGTDSAVATVTISVTDVDEPPDAPSPILVTAVTDSSTRLTVSWTAPANDGKPDIESYDVRYRAGSSGDWSDGPEDVTTTTTTVSGLTADTEYEVQVRATNDEGDSDWSDPPGSGQTNMSTNIAPTAADKTVTTVQNTNYTFSRTDFGFVDADDDQLASVLIVTVPTAGRLVLNGDTVMASQTVTRTEIVVGSGLKFEPADGASGTGYASFTFKVNDGTDDSVSAYTMTINVTIITAPGVPTALTATASGQAWIELAWTAPVRAGGRRHHRLQDRGLPRWQQLVRPRPRRRHPEAPPPPTPTWGSTPAPPATTASPPSTSWATSDPSGSDDATTRDR